MHTNRLISLLMVGLALGLIACNDDHTGPRDPTATPTPRPTATPNPMQMSVVLDGWWMGYDYVWVAYVATNVGTVPINEWTVRVRVYTSDGLAFEEDDPDYGGLAVGASRRTEALVDVGERIPTGAEIVSWICE